MEMFKVALLQLLAAGNDQEANLLKGDEACREAASLGADMALFPEMWNIGYYEWGEDAGDDAKTTHLSIMPTLGVWTSRSSPGSASTVATSHGGGRATRTRSSSAK